MEKYFKAKDVISVFENLMEMQSSYGMHDKAIDTGYYIQLLWDQPTIEINLDEPKEQASDITSGAGSWIQVSIDPDRVRWKCSSCGIETDLPNYEKANYCFSCGTKMYKEK